MFLPDGQDCRAAIFAAGSFSLAAKMAALQFLVSSAEILFLPSHHV
jgi:hypothetical protein